jgi:hypothetical protein
MRDTSLDSQIYQYTLSLYSSRSYNTEGVFCSEINVQYFTAPEGKINRIGEANNERAGVTS